MSNSNLTKFGVICFVTVVTGLVIMFVFADNSELQERILGYFGTLVTFIAGAGTGGVAAGFVGFWRGVRHGRAQRESDG